MNTFFSPGSVAIVGASSTPGKIGYEILKNVLASHKGDVFPVNPNAQEILGKPCYPTLQDIEKHVDLAILVIPPDVSHSVITDCAKKGVPSVVIVSGGFGEVGKKSLQQDIVTTAQKKNVRIIGPNCIGIFNGRTGFNTFFQTNIDKPGPGKVAILTQSGAFGIAILEWLAHSNVGVSKFVSFGNKSDVDEIDLLTYLEHDTDTQVIGIYMEWLEKGKEFLSVAKRIGLKKPIVLLKAGRTSLGAHVALSHTGSMSQNDAIFAGAVRQAGCLLTRSFEEFYDTLRILSQQPLPSQGSLALITNGAGPCVIAADHIHSSPNLVLASLESSTLDTLETSLPPFCIISNPLDLTGSATADHYLSGMKALLNDPNVGILMPFFVFQDAPIADTISQLHAGFSELLAHKKTIVVVSTGGSFTERQGEQFSQNHIPQIQDPVRAVAALEKIVSHQLWKKRQGESQGC